MLQSRILIVSILLGFSSLLGHAEGQTCNEDYRTLANALINTSDNKYQLSIAFFPINRAPPAFVSVIYRYDDTNITDQEWLWSAGAFYFFQPLRIYQFTSLFFGNPEFRSGTVTLTLPANCSTAPAPLMETLTQRLKLIASSSEAYPKITDTYQAKATNETRVNKSFYNRDNHDILALIHTAQVLFPVVSTSLSIVCFIYWCCVYRKASRPPSNEDWSTLAAYYGVSFYFTSFVFCLDWAAVHYTRTDKQLFVIENDLIRGLVGAPTFFDFSSFIFIVIVGFGFIVAKIHACCVAKTRNECLDGLASTDSTNVKYTNLQFIWLSTAGFSPFVCVTSHAHFILIAWITDPSYAFGIGVFYGISFFVYFVTFKFLYYEFVHCTCCNGNTEPPPSRNTRNGTDQSQDRGSDGDTGSQPPPSRNTRSGTDQSQDRGSDGDTGSQPPPSRNTRSGTDQSQDRGSDGDTGSQPPPSRNTQSGTDQSQDRGSDGDTGSQPPPSRNTRNGTDQSQDRGSDGDTGSQPPAAFSCLALSITLGIGVFLTGYLAMIACFFVYIPISKSIEDTPTQVYAIYQGIIVVLTVLVTYVVVAKPGSSLIDKGVKIALKRAGEIKSNWHNMSAQEWKKISDEERLAEVLTMAIEDYNTRFPKPNQ